MNGSSTTPSATPGLLNGYVTKTQVLLWLGSVIALIFVAGFSLHQVHAARPHKGAAEKVDIADIKSDIKELRELVIKALEKQ